VATGSPASAATAAQSGDPARRVSVVEVSGRIDPVLADFVRHAVDDAAAEQVELLVLQVNSPGALVSDDALRSLARDVEASKVPVAVWVGPSGARAYGGAYVLVRAAGVLGMAQGSRIGDRGGRLGATEAKSRDVVDVVAPTLGDFIVGLDGRKVGTTTLETAKVVRTADGPRQQVNAVVSFSKPGLTARLLHTVSSPAVGYLLLVIGLLLLVFEFFTAGVGVAGVVGAGALVLSAYGLTVLPTRPLGLLLVALGVFGFAVDVQTGVPRAWTVIGGVSLAVGGWFFYGGGLFPGILPWVVVTVGTPLFMIGGMAGMVRSRFSTPTIGRASMIGEQGVAVGAVNPEGTVRVRGGLWRARTNRATPIAGGDTVRVAAIDGLLLEVEPISSNSANSTT
jgi:membrane-bound serine protease (ClpP class)